MIVKYLTESRELEKNLVMEWIVRGDIYEEKKHHNVVFIGRDADGIPRYAHCRGTGEMKYRGDVAGSDKAFGFCHRGSLLTGRGRTSACLRLLPRSAFSLLPGMLHNKIPLQNLPEKNKEMK